MDRTVTSSGSAENQAPHVGPVARKLCSDCCCLTLPELWFSGPREILLDDGSKCLDFTGESDSEADGSQSVEEGGETINEYHGSDTEDSSEVRFPSRKDVRDRHGLGPPWSEDHLDVEIITRDDTLPHLPVLQRSAADKGCDMCTFMRTAILQDIAAKHGEAALEDTQESPARIVLKLFWGINRDWSNRSGLVCCELQYWQEIRERKRKKILLSVETDDAARTWLRTDDLVCSCPLCPKNVSKIKSLLGEDAQTSEMQSRRVVSLKEVHERESFLPTRLIDLGTSPEAAPRIIITNEDLIDIQRSRIHYATLSYCWGPRDDAKKQSKLTAANFAERRSGISVDSLSPVARDAARVCWALGIRYLWIDALCIIQGDPKDWSSESTLMAYIYGHSFLTICPISSSSCQEGFLEKVLLEPRIRIPVIRGIDGPESTREANVASCLRPAGTYHFIHRAGVTSEYRIPARLNPPELDNLKGSGWASRGWTFQEYILSKRRIYFGKRMVHFEDNEIFWSQNDLSIPKDLSQVGLSYFQSIDQTLLRDLWWTKVRRDFMSRQWTYVTDLLPSIAGFARLCHERLGEKYVCGNWEPQLYKSVLFARSNEDSLPSSLQERIQQLQQREQFIAPSWSWASDIIRFSFSPEGGDVFAARHRMHMDPAYETLIPHVEIPMDSGGPFGKVSELSYLEVTARYVAVSESLGMIPSAILNPSDELYDADRQAAMGMGARFNFDWKREKGQPFVFTQQQKERGELLIILVSATCSTLDEESTGPVVTIGLESLEQPAREECPYCGGREGKDKSLSEKSERNAWGLLLYRKTTPQGDEAVDPYFYRVGMFFSLVDHGFGMNIFANADTRTFRIK